jgi:hypothetical protein
MPKSWLYLESGMGTMSSSLPYLDLAEFLSVDEQSRRLIFYSIGDAPGYRVPDGTFSKELQPGQDLL